MMAALSRNTSSMSAEPGPEAEAVEGLLVDQEGQEERRVVGVAAGHHEGRRERVLEAQDDVAEGQQHQPGHEQRQGQVAEGGPASGSVHGAGVEVLARQAAQGCQEDHEALADLEQRHDDEGEACASHASASQAGMGRPRRPSARLTGPKSGLKIHSQMSA